MTGQSILLFDPSLERASSTNFLLQLASYSVAVVRSAEEAFNWLVSRVNSSAQANLLVINDHSLGVPMYDLLPQLRQQGVEVPVLSVLRDNVDRSDEGRALDQLILCRPENLLGQVRVLAAQV